MRLRIALYGESAVRLSRWRANVKSPITTLHCCPRKSFVRQELEADSAEKLGRKLSSIPRALSLVPRRCIRNFVGIQISSCRLAVYNRSCDIAALSPSLSELFNIILKEFASPHSPALLSLFVSFVPSHRARFLFTARFCFPVNLLIERKADYYYFFLLFHSLAATNRGRLRVFQ